MRLSVHGVVQEQRWVSSLSSRIWRRGITSLPAVDFYSSVVQNSLRATSEPKPLLWYGLALNVTTRMNAKFKI